MWGHWTVKIDELELTLCFFTLSRNACPMKTTNRCDCCCPAFHKLWVTDIDLNICVACRHRPHAIFISESDADLSRQGEISHNSIMIKSLCSYFVVIVSTWSQMAGWHDIAIRMFFGFSNKAGLIRWEHKGQRMLNSAANKPKEHMKRTLYRANKISLSWRWI